MKPEYYIYTWLPDANFSYDLCKGVSGYCSRRTAERIAFIRYNHLNGQIRYCVALTDEEAYAELKRQTQSQPLEVREFDTNDTEICYKCGRRFHVRSGMFGNQFCTDCLLNTRDADNRKEGSE